MTTANYRFTFADFNPNSPLSQCCGQPPIAAYIRWLRWRSELLSPNYAEPAHIELCEMWWSTLVGNEFDLHCEMRASPHARFDMEPDDERVEAAFPHETGPITMAACSDTVLDTDDPDPFRDQRFREEGGDQPRTRLRFHEMLAMTALSDLFEAIDLLVSGSVAGTPDLVRVEHERAALTLVVGAVELVSRAERHAQALSKVAVAAKTRKVHAPQTVSAHRSADSTATGRSEPESEGKVRFSDDRNGWVEQYESYLRVGYGGGDPVRIDNIRWGGKLSAAVEK